MQRRLIGKVLVAVFLLGVVMFPAQSVGATSEFFANRTVILDQYQYKYFMVARTIAYSPYGIAFQKDDGPAMNMKWTYCGYTYGGEQTEAYIPNGDPQGYILFKPNNSPPSSLRWCWAIEGLGNDVDNSFEGTLDWDGYYG